MTSARWRKRETVRPSRCDIDERAAPVLNRKWAALATHSLLNFGQVALALRDRTMQHDAHRRDTRWIVARRSHEASPRACPPMSATHWSRRDVAGVSVRAFPLRSQAQLYRPIGDRNSRLYEEGSFLKWL